MRPTIKLPIALAEDQERELRVVTDNWVKGNNVVSAGQELVEPSKVILASYARTMSNHKLVFNNVVTKVSIQHRVVYPKSEVEKLLSEEQLQGIAKVTDVEIVKISRIDKGEK